MSLTQLPHTLQVQGTEIEKLDFVILLNMEAIGTITEQDTLALNNKGVLPISCTMHYLQYKVKAWTVFCIAYFGEAFYLENFNKLWEIKATTDRDLPIKIEIAISDDFNRSLWTAMPRVSDKTVFQDELRKQSDTQQIK